MQHRDDPGGDDGDGPRDAPPDPARTPVDRRFADLIGALRRADPPFARRVSEARRLRAGHLMALVGVVATTLLGFVPLALGLHLGVGGLLWTGALATAVGPVLAPLITRSALRRARPAW